VTTSLFRAAGDQLIPMPASIGPWMAGTLAGTAIGALVAALSERLPAPRPMLPVRMSVEFLRPVPNQPLDVETRVVREGRKQQILAITLWSGGKAVVNTTILRLREEPAASTPDAVPAVDFDPPAGPPFEPGVMAGRSLLQEASDTRMLRLNDYGPGETEGWFRYLGTVIEGEAMTPFQRAALFADYGNGMAPIVHPRAYSYLNADISLHLARLPRSEWLLLKARTLGCGNGLAMTRLELADPFGQIGWSHQSLVIDPRG